MPKHGGSERTLSSNTIQQLALGTSSETEDTAEAPYGPGSAPANEDGSASDGFDIKGNADSIRTMEVQGLTIPAFAKSPGAAASSRELRRRSRARSRPGPAG